MVKKCDFCNNKAKLECKRHKKQVCRDHAVKCPYCNVVVCVDCFEEKGLVPVCPNCKKELIICPNCLKNKNISRLQQGIFCKKCNYKK